MKASIKLSLAAAIVVAGLGVPDARAKPVMSFFNAGDSAAGDNTLVDDNREYLIDRVNSETKGQIDVGDSIRGLAIWSKINGVAIGLGTANQELSSVFQVMVTGKQETSAGSGTYNFTFGPDPDFAEADALGLAGQAMMVFYQDASPDGALDYNDPGSPLPANSIDDGTTFNPPSSEDVSSGMNGHEEAFISTATNGSFFWALGFTGDEDDGVAAAADGEGWQTNAGLADSMLQFFDIDSGTDVASMNYAMNLLQSDSGTGLAEGTTLIKRPSSIDSDFDVDFNGSATFEGVRNELTPFEATTQSTLTFRIIPAPATAGLSLAMLAGLTLIGGRRLRPREGIKS
jgi:hypothetical protein